MGRGKNKILGSIIRPRKAKEERRAKDTARKAKDKKDFNRYILMSPQAFGDTDDYREASANAIRTKQARTIKRARMCTVDKPMISVSGNTVLLPNTSYPAASKIYEDEHGTQTASWRLGDGGSFELMLMGVDPRSISTWLDAFRSSCISCVAPGLGRPGQGAPIYARARIIQRTTESGQALQPIHEVAKNIALAAPSFVGGIGKVSAMGEALQGATGFVRDSATTAVDAAGRSADRNKAGQAALADARQLVTQKRTDDEFGLDNVNVTVGIVFSVAGEPHEEIGQGLWSIGEWTRQPFQRVMQDVRDKWSGA